MKRGVIRSSCSDDRGAVGPMYAIALVALVAIAGVGFDYGRMVTAQSELQNAADQAALAAATQLNGQVDARALAIEAARNYFKNYSRTVDDDDADGPLLDVPEASFTFYRNGNTNDLATSDADANAVEVSVKPRQVFYALTPIVAVMSSGAIRAHARAALQRAECNLPSIMLCLGRNGVLPPVQKGMTLKLLYGQLAPGAFGYLNVDGFDTDREMGLNKIPSNCSKLGQVEVRTGHLGNQRFAMATRFDYYDHTNKFACDISNGDFCTAEGVRKNLAISVPLNATITSPKATLTFDEAKGLLATQGALPSCPTSAPAKSTWTDFADISLLDSTAVNFGLDACFAAGTCQYVGDGNWPDVDKSRYFARYLPDQLDNRASFATRYDVYLKELSNPARYLKQGELVGFNVAWDAHPAGGVYTHKFSGGYCAYAQPLFGTAHAPVPPNEHDRRVLPVAIVDNCDQLTGTSTKPHIATYIDVFLLEPPVHGVNELDAEVIGPALQPGSDTGFQYYAHDKPVLIR